MSGSRRLHFAAVAIAATTAAVTWAAPAGAEPEDQQYFRALDRLGFVITDPPLLISQGRMICNEGLAHNVSWGEMHGQMLNWGYSHDSASVIAVAAIETYCPEYQALANQIAEGI
ncbi:DUF732 domain-containing protein [Mycobacterium sp. NPDC051804]|uniref:DUF732 domain-containing protein n=1 Tax=Mycobacterium sp. NPDC051804 TaxID=3364295 RepID=UPI00378A574E